MVGAERPTALQNESNPLVIRSRPRRWHAISHLQHISEISGLPASFPALGKFSNWRCGPRRNALTRSGRSSANFALVTTSPFDGCEAAYPFPFIIWGIRFGRRLLH